MAYLQHIIQEQEAEALEDQIKINFSLETQVFLNYHYGSRNRRKILKMLFRANVVLNNQRTDKTRYLSLKSVEIANTVLHKIVNGRKVLLSHQYLSKITECDTSKQNNNIIAQLANLFDITNHNFLYRDGKVYRHHVEFKLKASVLEEAKDSGALISEFHWKKISSPINNNKNISNRNIIRSRANFSNVKNSNSQNLGTEPEKAKNLVAKGSCINSQANQQAPESFKTPQELQVVETTSPKAATVTPIRTKAQRPSNKRRTRSNAEQKQIRAANVPATKTAPKVVSNGFLAGGKRLSEIQPYLTDELCEKLRSKSGKLFTNKAIREITKAIAASDKGSQAFFYHINGVVSYLIPALIREKRDPNKIGSESYYTTAGMTAEDKLLHEREKYLNETENSGIHARCDYTQYRARIAGQFPVNLAYALLTNMVEVKKQEHVLKVTMHKLVPLSKNYVQLLLKHAKGIGGYAGVSGLEFVGIASNSNFLSDLTQCRNSEPRSELTLREETKLPKGNWGKVCSAFISEYGFDLYRYWLAGLEVTENSEKGTIELRTSSSMVKDRIEQTYLLFLSKVAREFGINKVEFTKLNI